MNLTIQQLNNSTQRLIWRPDLLKQKLMKTRVGLKRQRGTQRETGRGMKAKHIMLHSGENEDECKVIGLGLMREVTAAVIDDTACSRLTGELKVLPM